MLRQMEQDSMEQDDILDFAIYNSLLGGSDPLTLNPILNPKL